MWEIGFSQHSRLKICGWVLEVPEDFFLAIFTTVLV